MGLGLQPRVLKFESLIALGETTLVGLAPQVGRILCESSKVVQNATMKIRVLVLEDDPFTRISVAAALRHFDFDVVVEESSTGLAVEKAANLKPDAAVLDLHLGNGPTGLDVAVALRSKFPEIGIVLLTSFDDPRFLGASIPEIPSGTVYLTKASVQNLSRIKTAVMESISAGTRAIKVSKVPAFENLSDSHIETLRLIAQGYSNAEIAKRRFVKEKSVEVAVTRLAKILGLEHSISSNQRVNLARVYFRSIGAKEFEPEA